jgi:hypothetical protein
MLVGITTYFIIFHAAPLFFFVVYTASIAGGAALSYNQSQQHEQIREADVAEAVS